MISCEKGTQSLNLLYSVIKFVSFENFRHEGDQLYLPIHHLGELMQVQAVLKDERGRRQEGVSWEEGTLFARFSPERRYSLELRLEYGAPYALEPVYCDLNAIPPLHMRFCLDTGVANLPSGADLQVQIGSDHFQVPLDDERFERDCEHGYRADFQRRDEYCSLTLEQRVDHVHDRVFYPALYLAGSPRHEWRKARPA